MLVSAATGFGLDTLRAEIAALLASLWEDVDVAVPYAAGELLARVRERGTVDLEYGDRDVRVTGRMAPGLAGELRVGGRALGGDASPRRAWRPERRRSAPAFVRRAGSGRTAAGDRVWWSVAEGRRGRRWREAIVGDAAGCATRCCSRPGPDGRFSHLELADAGRAADAAPRGRRDAPRERDRGRRDPARRRAPVGRGGRRGRRGLGGRRAPRAPGCLAAEVEARRVGCDGRSCAITAGLLITTGPEPVERIDQETWRIAGGAPCRVDADGLPVLPDAESWPLEQAE